MKPQFILIATLALAGITASADESATAAFGKLKTLAGQWEADTPQGKAHLSYELIAGGTAVEERISSDKMPVMVTVYHLDGGRLLLTHYCMAGNQPRMLAGPFHPDTGELEFQFLDATNLAAGAGHMHSARMRFVDSNHLVSEWQFDENGKPKFTESARYTRVQ